MPDASAPPAVVITGASTGIGRACALVLDGLGHRVFAGVRKAVDGDALEEAASDRLVPLMLDVCDSESIRAAVTVVREAVGEAGLAGLINNAGIALGGPIEFIPIADVRRQFEVNVYGLLETTQAFMPLLRAGGGRIVNISSQGGKISAPFFGIYCASKHALEAISDSLRQELKPWGLHVAVVEPGSIDTAIWGKGLDQFSAIESKLPLEARTLYEQGLASLRRRLAATAARGIAPERVADVVVHALTAEKPRTRYAVGSDAKRALWAKRWLSDRMLDYFIARDFEK